MTGNGVPQLLSIPLRQIENSELKHLTAFNYSVNLSEKLRHFALYITDYSKAQCDYSFCHFPPLSDKNFRDIALYKGVISHIQGNTPNLSNCVQQRKNSLLTAFYQWVSIYCTYSINTVCSVVYIQYIVNNRKIQDNGA